AAYGRGLSGRAEIDGSDRRRVELFGCELAGPDGIPRYGAGDSGLTAGPLRRSCAAVRTRSCLPEAGADQGDRARSGRTFRRLCHGRRHFGPGHYDRGDGRGVAAGTSVAGGCPLAGAAPRRTVERPAALSPCAGYQAGLERPTRTFAGG